MPSESSTVSVVTCRKEEERKVDQRLELCSRPASTSTPTLDKLPTDPLLQRCPRNSPFKAFTSFNPGTSQTFAPPLQLPVAINFELGENRTVDIGRVSPI